MPPAGGGQVGGIVDGGRRRTQEAQAGQVITVGLGMAKSWFRGHGVNDRGQVVPREKLARP
jgi:hypothetical protein